MNIKKISFFFLFLVYFLNVIDLIVTFFGVNKFGLVAESNQMLIYLIKNFGWEITGFLKIIVVFIFSIPLIIQIKYGDKKFEHINVLGLFILICLFVYIIISWLMIL